MFCQVSLNKQVIEKDGHYYSIVSMGPFENTPTGEEAAKMTAQMMQEVLITELSKAGATPTKEETN